MKRIAVLVSFMLMMPLATYADTIVAGFTFNDNAFADSLTSSTGTWGQYQGGSSANIITLTAAMLQTNVLGSNIDSHAFCIDGPAVCSLTLGFTDNVLVNRLGNDLAIFELGQEDIVTLIIGGITRQYQTAYTGFDYNGPAGHLNQINVALVNLDAFAIAPLGTVSQFQVQTERTRFGYAPTYTVFGALNSGPTAVPEPSALLLLLTGLTSLAALKKQRGGS